LELANSVVIKRGSEIPCLKSESFTRTQDQKRVKCEVTEAESDTDEIKFVNVIWEDAFEDLPTGKSQKPEIRVTYEYTENQTMKCWFLDVESGQEIKHDININAPTSNDKNQPAPSDFKIE
jgi:molecular chaperone DnaK (HSP70)